MMLTLPYLLWQFATLLWQFIHTYVVVVLAVYLVTRAVQDQAWLKCFRQPVPWGPGRRGGGCSL